MSQLSKNELKHLLNPDTGEWIGEYDPVLVMDSVEVEAVGATTLTLHTVATGKTLYGYAFLVSNVGDSGATYALLNGATVKIPPIYIISQDVHLIPEGPNPRAPIVKFGENEAVNFRTSGATLNCVMSYWEAETE